MIKYLAIICLLPLSLYAQSDLITALNHNLIPIKTLTPEEDFSDLQPLKTILKDKHIIGLGEATHGTKEFFLYKHRLVRFLVTELGFKTFVIEADFAGAQVMNDYVVYGKGNPYSGLKAMGVGVWMTQEFVDMVEWIKQYNSTKAFSDKVKFYGCDMQFPATAAKVLKEEITQTTTFTEECKKGLDFIINWKFQKASAQEIKLLTNMLFNLKNITLIESDSNKLNLYKQYIRTIEQWIECFCEPSWYKQYSIRDKYMAENCKWTYYEEKQNKMIIWAHNGHIAKNATVNDNLPMGYYLAQNFSEHYYAFGFGFNSGTVRAAPIPDKGHNLVFTIPEIKIKKSSDYIFSQCNSSNFILDFQNTSTKSMAITKFLNNKVYSRSIGAAYSPKIHAKGKDIHRALVTMYDGMIFIKETTAVSPQFIWEEMEIKSG